MWIDNKDWDTSAGRLRKAQKHRLKPPPEPTYSIAQVAEIFDVSKQTIYKWLIIDGDDSVIPPNGWFKLPGSGHIRIKRSAVVAIYEENR